MTAAAGSQTVMLMIRFCLPPTTVSPAKMTTGFVFVTASIAGTVPPPCSRSSRSPAAAAAVAVSYAGSRATPHSSAVMTSPSRDIVTSGRTDGSASRTVARACSSFM